MNTEMGEMVILSRRSMLAIAATVDVALFSRPDPVSTKQMAARHHLPPQRDSSPAARACPAPWIEAVGEGSNTPFRGQANAREAAPSGPGDSQTSPRR